MIIGIVGPICSGKDELAAVLVSDFKFKKLSLADELREELRARGKEITRVGLQDLGDELREKDVSDLTKRVISKISDGDYVITGFRNPGEMGPLLELPGFMILMMDAPLEVRFDRAFKRGREKEAKTLEDFKKIEERDLGIGQPSHGQQNAALFEMANKKIVNSGSLEDLREKVGRLLEELKR